MTLDRKKVISIEACTRAPLFRPPRIRDGAAIHALIESCPPLDLNSVYSYLILCKHFSETCMVAEERGEIIAFTSGYIPPATPDTLFIWQVAVGERARGRGLGKRLLGELMRRPACRKVRHLETTITPSNQASWRLFIGFAEGLDATCEDRTLFRDEHFGEADHEPEQLLRVGPLRSSAAERLIQSR